MTAVMAETARKGLWDATPEQLREISALHVDLVDRYKPGCSGFVCDNAKLREVIRKNVGGGVGDAYLAAIDQVRENEAARSGSRKVEGLALEKVETTDALGRSTSPVDATAASPPAPEFARAATAVGVVAALIGGITMLGYLKRRR